MKNILKFIPASLITTVVLAVFITAYYNLTPGFIALPNFVQQFNDLSNREVVDFIRYAYQTSVYGIVYGVYNVFTKQIYIGSTIVPAKRVYEHLVSGNNSNKYLQNSINKYGIDTFQFIIFEVVYSSVIGVLSKGDFRAVEQHYIDLFPKEQLFNSSLLPLAEVDLNPKRKKI